MERGARWHLRWKSLRCSESRRKGSREVSEEDVPVKWAKGWRGNVRDHRFF